MNIIALNKKNRATTKIKYCKDIPYISYNALEKYDWLVQGFSTRIGGISAEHLASMNLGFGRGDDLETVIKNHEIMAQTIGFDPHNIVTSNQTHTTNIRVVTKDDCGKGLYKERDFSDIDGMITNEKGVILATYYADCVPLYIIDPINHAVGLSHSGWRGTVHRIGERTIKKMEAEYGSKAENLVVCIGPSICQDCYEISEDVADEFKREFTHNINDILIKKENNKYQLDLWKCNEIIFRQAGVIPQNINQPDICTCCNAQFMFSHRASNGLRGNLAAFLGCK